ncbi:MAG TPA: hypothetical protein VGK71_05495 [Nitrospirota bacterium]|jgi:hypothetical protein
MDFRSCIVSLAALLFLASPAAAGDRLILASNDTGNGGKFDKLISDTEQDYWSLKACFADAYASGCSSWEDYKQSTGFQVSAIESKIIKRLETLDRMHHSVNDILPENQRSQANEVIGYLESSNRTMLALIQDDHGYIPCMSGHNEELRSEINIWHEGIRMSLADTRSRAQGVRNSYEAQALLTSFTDQ